MSNSTAAIRYAKSLYALGNEKSLVDSLLADMSLFLETVKANYNLHSLIQSPIIPGLKKKVVIS